MVESNKLFQDRLLVEIGSAQEGVSVLRQGLADANMRLQKMAAVNQPLQNGVPGQLSVDSPRYNRNGGLTTTSLQQNGSYNICSSESTIFFRFSFMVCWQVELGNCHRLYLFFCESLSSFLLLQFPLLRHTS